MPDELYIEFTIQVLRERGPKNKMRVLRELVEHYIREKQKRTQEEPSPALQAEPPAAIASEAR
jgi:hypothetical protein